MSKHRLVISAVAGASIAACLQTVPAAGAAIAPKIISIRCWPSGACPGGLRVPRGGSLLVTADMPLNAPVASLPGAGRVTARRARDGRLIVKVPDSAVAGPIRIAGTGTPWSAPSAPVTPVPSNGVAPPRPTGSPFDGNGMWIWTLSATEGGSLSRIAARAAANDITTLFVKSSDSDHLYPRGNPQFTRNLVAFFHARGIRVCAWPFVYGRLPRQEAAMTVEAVRRGADCVAIDAEGEYEGRYSAATTYVSTLRKAIGTSYPLSLAGLPYVDYHPSFPFSVFLGRGAAQFNQPQAYWQDIGRSVDEVMSHTWSVNAPYGRVIVPLGQAWAVKRNSELLRFRSLSAAWGAPGVSWWDWQESRAGQWPAFGSALPWPNTKLASPEWIHISYGNKGDLVLWAQQHLIAHGRRIKPTGRFDVATRAAVAAFQASRGLLPTGVVDGPTWRALLRVTLPLPGWAGAPAGNGGSSGGSGGHGTPPVNVTSVERHGGQIPTTAHLPGRDEFAAHPRRSIQP